MIGKIVLDNSSLNDLPSHKKKYRVGISGERKICQRFHVTTLNWSNLD
jgi:hypothetical protein